MTMTRIDLRFLGGFEVRLSHGSPLTVPTRKAQGLLAYLALPCGVAHPRDKLAALLWGDMREGQARANLRQTLFMLRKALPVAVSDALRLDAPTMALEPAAVDVDVATFEHLTTAGTPDALARAAAVYQGDLLQGLAVREAPFEEWLMAERERLRELALEALAKLLAQQRAAGTTEVAVQTALRLLALDPLLEPAHRTLMRLYAQLGRRDTALRQYQMCVDVLRRELGVEPEEETKQLYREILRVRLLPPPTTAGSGGKGSPSHAAVLHLCPLTPATGTRLVGREADVARLNEAMTGAEGGRGQLVVILGEAGIGKTRLVSELASGGLQSRSRRVLIGRCHEAEQIVPFGPWAEAFRGAHISDDLTHLRDDPAWRRELARLLPELDWRDAADTVGSADPMRLFEAVAQLLNLLAARQPLLLILEDLHWADEMSVRLLAYLGHRLQDWPILLVATARADEPEAAFPTRWIEAQEREPQVLRLVLAPLSHPETETLVRMLAPAGVPGTVLVHLGEKIWHISQGNPFVAVETMRTLSEEAMQAASPDVPLPSCVRESITRRLNGLTSNAGRLAAVGAVIGRDFDFHVLPRTAGLSEGLTAEALEELVRRHILQAKGDRFAFVHDRVREVAYARLLSPRRKLLHREVAEALEALYATNLEPQCAALGFHYSQGEVWPKATVFLRRAGMAATAHSAYREAMTCLEQALLCARYLPDEPASTALMIDLRLDLYQPLLSLGELPKLFETLRGAETLAEALNDRGRLGRVWSGLSQYFRLVGDPGRAIEMGQRAVATARALGDLDLELGTSYRLAQAHQSRGDYREAARLLTRSIGLLEPEELGATSPPLAESAVLSRVQLAFCHAETGEITSAIATGEEALCLAEALDRVDLIAGAHCGLGMAYLSKGEFARASAMLEECVRLCRLRDLRVWLAWAESPLGEAYTLAGRVPAAVVRLKRAVNHAAFLKHSHAMRVVNLGEAYLWHGRLIDARGAAQQAISLAREHQERGHEAWALRLLGEIESRSDPPNWEAAKTNYHHALEHADELGMRPLVARCHLGLGSLYREMGDQLQAQGHVTTAMGLFREMGMESWVVRSEQLLRTEPRPAAPIQPRIS